MNDIDGAAFRLAAEMMATMSPRELDDMLIREGFLVATPCRGCGRETMWQPGAEDLCICNECACGG